MRIQVNDFGPIYKASIDVKPLTVIIGSNNVGKSFLGQLIYSIICSIKKPPNRVFGGQLSSVDFIDIVGFLLPEEEKLKENTILLFKEKQTISAFSNIFIHYLNLSFSENMEMLLDDALTSTFGVELKDLINFRTKSATFSFTLEPNVDFVATISDKGQLSVKTTFSKTFIKRVSNIILLRYKNISRAGTKTSIFLSSICNGISRVISNSLSINCSYLLPAGRSGLLDSWDTITASLINLASLAIPQGLSMPALPGTAAKLYNLLYYSGKKRTKEFPNITNYFQKLLNGDIVVLENKNTRKKEIFYEFMINKKPFHVNIIHAASMIKEIAPLYLTINNHLVENDLLIVEEPESHLHPKAQRQLINVFLGLIYAKANIFLTTHSDIFLRSITTEIAKSNKASKPKTNSKGYLSIILLKESKKGSISKQIYTNEFGTLSKIPSFDEIIDELYDEETRLEIAHND